MVDVDVEVRASRRYESDRKVESAHSAHRNALGRPHAVPELSVEDCAWATQGVAMSAMGATHLTVRFIPPPCANLHVHIDHCRACVVPRAVVVRLVYDEVGGAIRYWLFALTVSTAAVVMASQQLRHR